MSIRWTIVAFVFVALTLLTGNGVVKQTSGATRGVGVEAPAPTPSSQEPSPTLSPIVVAAIWLAIIASIGSIVALLARFYRKHNEHLPYDDHMSYERWDRGFHSYLRLMGKEDDEKDRGKKSP